MIRPLLKLAGIILSHKSADRRFDSPTLTERGSCCSGNEACSSPSLSSVVSSSSSSLLSVTFSSSTHFSSSVLLFFFRPFFLLSPPPFCLFLPFLSLPFHLLFHLPLLLFIFPLPYHLPHPSIPPLLPPPRKKHPAANKCEEMLSLLGQLEGVLCLDNAAVAADSLCGRKCVVREWR